MKSSDINKAQIAAIGVRHGTKILMGKRKDTGKWTMPGGHVEFNEEPHEAAKRELFEEAGLKARGIKPIGRGTGGKDNQHVVHAFVVDHDGKTKPTSINDPDNEVHKLSLIHI